MSKESGPHLGAWPKITLFYVWSNEIFNTTLVVITFVALVVTAHLHDGQPLPKWPFGLSINAIIAAYSAIIRASIGVVVSEGVGYMKWDFLNTGPTRDLSSFNAYDETSRGPWGATKHLFYFGWRWQHVLSSVGALLAILLLPIDPMVQQLIHVSGCQRFDPSIPASVASTRLYESIPDHEGFSDLRNLFEHMSQGLMAKYGPEVSWSCRTGNCSFTEYSSLAHCTSCSDTSDKIMKINASRSNDTGGSQVLPGKYRNLTIFSPDDASESMTIAMDFPPEVENWKDQVMTISALRFDTDLLVTDPNPTQDDPELLELPAKAYSCSIQPCVQRYTSVVEAGILYETEQTRSLLGNVPSLKRNDSSDDLFQVIVDLACVSRDSPENTAAFHRLGDSVDQLNERWLPLTSGTLEEAQNLAKGCVYAIDSALSNYIANSLDKYIKYTSDISMEDMYFRSLIFADILLANSTDDFFAAFENRVTILANFLTTYIRENGHPSASEPAIGSTSEYTTCLVMRWRWLSYVVILISLFFVFFSGLLIKSRQSLRRTVSVNGHFPHDFKNSALPLIFGGGTTNRTSHLEKLAKDTIARLVVEDDGAWKIVLTPKEAEGEDVGLSSSTNFSSLQEPGFAMELLEAEQNRRRSGYRQLHSTDL